MYDLKGACTDWTSNVENYRPNSLILLILRRLRANQGPNSLAGNFCTHQELACRTIDVHKAQAWSVAFEGRTFLVQHISDNNIVADGLHIERHVRVRKLFIHERFLSGVAVATFGRILVDLSLG